MRAKSRQIFSMTSPIDPKAVRFARWLFTGAGLYGVTVLTPNLLLETTIARASTSFTHPIYFYGFVDIALTWQVLFLLTGRDPVRYRPVMLVGVLEKISFAFPALALMEAGRGERGILPFATIDLMLGLLFLLAWWRLRAARG
jgi:hypothetical protein